MEHGSYGAWCDAAHYVLFLSEGAKKQKMESGNKKQPEVEADEGESNIDMKQKKRKHKSSESSVEDDEVGQKEKQQKLSENQENKKEGEVESLGKSDKTDSSQEEPKSDVCKMESALKRKSLDTDVSKDSKRVRISDKIAVKEIDKRKRKRRPSKTKKEPKDIPELRVMAK